jgi:hypothetical protein
MKKKKPKFKKQKKTFTVKEYSKRITKKKRLTEDQEQAILCKWIKETYPNILYTVDLGGIRLTMGQRVIMKSRAKRGHPDLMFQEWFLDKYCGLAIEFKRTGEKVSKLDGTLRKNAHLEEQLEYLTGLKERYYIAGFVIGIEAAKRVISAYLEAAPNSLAVINENIYPKINLK